MIAAETISTFEEHRPLLFAIAYRMLGSVMDAEDMVQEAYLRWIRASPGEIESPKAFLTTVVTRLCIDHQRAARVQREQYVGTWLPEPIAGATLSEAPESVALAESLSLAFLVLLESLSPLERAVFLLHDVFGYSFPEIAQIVEKSEANCRQIAHRARAHVKAHRPRFDVSPADQEHLTHEFLRACTTGDMDGLLETLAADATLYTDGGGKVRALPKPIIGADKIGRFFFAAVLPSLANFDVAPTVVNGGPGFVLLDGGRISGVIAFDFAAGRIAAIRVVVNPDKLHGVRGSVTPP